ncbi:bifunctional proline dehydrogenase/L-glutamate gamma-semialdehyde dehydrogenase [Rubripirellula amarantea]|nr:bifunctional proline dehydrogenase/L-glutamate gamma-semialdehyde dehydrogenase [Rubripirellula amarantea]
MILADDIENAIQLAGQLLRRAVELQTPQECRQQAELDRMIQHPADKATMIEITDQAFRTHCEARVADQLTHLLDIQGIPRFFSPLEKAMLQGFRSFGEYLPGVAVPLVKEKMRRETSNVILPAEPEHLRPYLKARMDQGVGMNINLLGEAILGEREARRRMKRYVEALRLPEVRCVSIKISTINSQISSIAREHTVRTVADKLEQLYRIANHEKIPNSDQSKFVYLDMEEYRDLYLTAQVMMETLDREGLETTRAGIALQAYIPDSLLVLETLIAWSSDRVKRGALPITIRLVKGANLEMERVEASIAGHCPAPFATKLETDANYKKMLQRLFEAAQQGTVRVGLASHNLFDVALGLVWTAQRGIKDAIQIEMLEGMANHQRRAISERFEHLLLYAPACRREEFLNAIGYLIRRLDENTGEQNFLRHAFRLRTDSEEFTRLADDFRTSAKMVDAIENCPRRDVRRRETPIQPPAADTWQTLVNEPDTDWAVPDNSAWIAETLNHWQRRCNDEATEVSLTINDELIVPTAQNLGQSLDPSRPDVVVCRYPRLTIDQVNASADIAPRDPSGWHTKSPDEIHLTLRRAAQWLRLRRGELIGAMVAEGGKTVAEADPEVSEAIDFCEFYPLTARHWSKRAAVSPRGVVAVITPWNFPLAIPCGGVAAALSMGNRVLLKPASQSVLVASMLCEAFWDSGVPREALHLVPCDETVAEAGLVANRNVDSVILTGATSTAKRMLAVRPDLNLLAETGGKNATIVTAMADRELAIKHVIHSAFGHAGQKCSATSILLLEKEVFEDESFRETLADAVESLIVGSAWDLFTKVGPLISPPGKTLTRGLKTLEDDESWLVVPEHIVGNPNLYRPGVKWNVKPGSFSHMNEMFGPVLSVMSYSRLEEAIAIVKRTGYGLTSGLESLDEREIQIWKESTTAGNLYINRPTTGAIVLRQPFGGVGLSAYGPGIKAGGPHYVLTLAKIENKSHIPGGDRSPSHPVLDEIDNWVDQSGMPEASCQRMMLVSQSARIAWEDEFSTSHDHQRLLGQDNIRRYKPLTSLTLRIESNDQWEDALTALSCAIAVLSPVTISIDPTISETIQQHFEELADALPRWLHPVVESDADLSSRIQHGEVERLRFIGTPEINLRSCTTAAEQFVTVVDSPVVDDGRIECLRYLNEQSISHDYHRYGNLGRRSQETRGTRNQTHPSSR